MRLRLRTTEQCAHCLALEYRIGKLEPRKGDVLVLRVPKSHSAFELEQLNAQLQRLAPEVMTIVVTEDLGPAIARRVRLEELGIAGPGS